MGWEGSRGATVTVDSSSQIPSAETGGKGKKGLASGSFKKEIVQVEREALVAKGEKSES